MLRIILVIAAPLLAMQTGQTSTWRKFSPKGGSFTVSLPGTPKETKQQLKVGDAVAEVTVHVCSAPGDGAYVVSVTEYPEQEVQGGLDQRLRNARDGVVQKSKGKLFHERKISLAAHPGKELWIQTGEDGLIQARLYAVKNRLYQTMAIGPKQFVETKETEGFLNSFKLVSGQ
jgi:hypothetical protein